MDLLLLASVLLIWVALVRSIQANQKEKYRQMENTAISATADIMNVTVETAVSIAKSIYTNSNIYSFLNTEYETTSEYFSVYYPLQENTALNITNTNIIKSCAIYTSNSSVIEVKNIKKLSDAKDSYWYQYFTKTKKPTVMCVDPDTGDLVLVRRLDYQALKTGESYICMHIEPSVLNNFADDVGFDGELYVMSGGYLIYSSDKKASSADDVVIGSDFQCIQRNYYTTEIEFYSRSAKKGFKEFVTENLIILIILIAVTIAALIIGLVIAINMKRRIRRALNEFETTGSMKSLSEKNNGKDEIGLILTACGSMSEKLEVAGSEFKQHSDSLVRKSSEYDSLFATAMRLDAEILVSETMPELVSLDNEEYYSLSQESELLKKVTLKYGGTFKGSVSDSDLKVPAYSLVLIANDAFRELGAERVTISSSGDIAEIKFEGKSAPKSTDILKLSAIFEDDVVSSEYSFDRSYRFNPYLRLRHCLGKYSELEINGKNKLIFIIRIRNNK